MAIFETHDGIMVFNHEGYSWLSAFSEFSKKILRNENYSCAITFQGLDKIIAMEVEKLEEKRKRTNIFETEYVTIRAQIGALKQLGQTVRKMGEI